MVPRDPSTRHHRLVQEVDELVDGAMPHSQYVPIKQKVLS